MNTHNQMSQPQSGEEMVKRLLAVAELLSKGIITDTDNVETDASRKKTRKNTARKIWCIVVREKSTQLVLRIIYAPKS